MKSKKQYFKHLSVFVLILAGLTSGLFAQNSTLELKTLRTSDDGRLFTVKLIGESEEGAIPVYKAKIDFFSLADNKSEPIGSCTTDMDGKGSLKIPTGQKFLKNKEGIAEIKAVFSGQSKLNSSEASVKFKEMEITISLAEKVSVNSILVHATAKGSNGEMIPLKETNFNLYVQGLFTRLKVGECFVDAGEGAFEFPKNIPGDENGNLKIFVRLEENEVFGDVEKEVSAKWGNHRSGYAEPVRSLWTSGAPIWMITTLIILLAGVWSHYLYAIIQLIRIKKEGKKIEQI